MLLRVVIAGHYCVVLLRWVIAGRNAGPYCGALLQSVIALITLILGDGPMGSESVTIAVRTVPGLRTKLVGSLGFSKTKVVFLFNLVDENWKVNTSKHKNQFHILSAVVSPTKLRINQRSPTKHWKKQQNNLVNGICQQKFEKQNNWEIVEIVEITDLGNIIYF
jgi:hypothetical protein